MNLTTEQQKAVDMAVEAIEGNRLFKIGGYAGTGKTSVARYIAEKVPGCMPCAFTGKAAYRLRQKGLFAAKTIHRTIYEYVGATKVNGKKTLRFTLKPDVDGDWFLVDEGSMIPAGLWKDLTSFRKPILLLGDPGQLEPVGTDARLMHKCDIVLEHIHRQAEGNGIIQFATDIRKDTFVAGNSYPDVTIDRDPARIRDMKWADIIICAFNRTRIRTNKKYRLVHGYSDQLVCKNERIIVLKNNSQFGVFNGQMLTVKSYIGANDCTVRVRCETDDGVSINLPLWKDQFNCKPLDLRQDDVVMADYGYAITTHKSQGSEWDKVVVIDEQCPHLWDAKRWRYTAVTRAAKELRYFEE